MALKRLTEIYNQIEKNKQELEFMPTGFDDMDKFLDGGFLRKELVVLGASTGIGKSYVAGQITMHIASKGFNCAYFSLEISNQMVVSRMVGSIANIKPIRVMCGFLTREEFENKTKAKAQLSLSETYLNFYDDVYEYAEISKEIKEKKFEFIVVDFIQNVVNLGMDEYSRLSYVALELQKLAKETNSCILVLSQLSNMIARDKKLTSVEYKGSGSIATVADLCFVLQREEDWSKGDSNKVKILLRKNRRGISGQMWEYTFIQPGGLIK